MAAIIGIDLGSHSIKVAHVMARRDDFEVTQYFQAALPPALSEMGEAIPLEERYRVALADLKDQGALEGGVFITGLPGDAASMRTLTFPFSDVRKIEQAIPFELEAEIPFDIDDVVYSWTVLGKKRVQRIEVSGEVSAPETEVLVCFAQRDDMEAHLDLLAERAHTTGELVAACTHLCRTAVMKHADVLEAAGLLVVRREGRVRWNHLNPVPIQAIYERWVKRHVRGHAASLQRLKRTVETKTNAKKRARSK